jgi:hypothetical protein
VAGALDGPRYRARQVLAVLRSRSRPVDPAPANAVLPPELARIWAAMPPEDQSHGLSVLEAVKSETSDITALQAALLHDAGKAQAGVGIAHRSLRVLLAKRWPGLWLVLAGTPTGWRRPFWAVANHPARGAVWVASAGGSPELAMLVRHHEEDAPAEWAGTDLLRWHACLARADARL